MSTTPNTGPATAAEAGRNCPYCRFPLKEGAATTRCATCHGAHHEDCWVDNGGCAMMGCAGAPGATPVPVAPAPIPVAPAPVPVAQMPTQTQAVPVAPSPVQPPTRRDGGGSRWLVASVLVLALVVAGAAVALVLTRQTQPQPAAAPDTGTTAELTQESASEPAPDTEALAEATAEPVDDGRDTDSPSLVNMTRAQMRTQIADLLRTWHEDVGADDAQAAFDMMTERKQAKVLREDGFAAWSKAQTEFGEDLDPSGVRVRIDDVDDDTGVVRVDVSGMRYFGPNSCGGDWSGITWVRFENGAFKYDPGYSTTPQREREWKARMPELLGGSC